MFRVVQAISDVHSRSQPKERDMTSQTEKAKQFAGRHTPGEPIVLLNIWDAGSARAVEAGGAQALATGSHSVAGALGYEDGEAAPLEDVVWMLARICAATELPVSHDTERGYGDTPEQVGESCARVIGAGAVGVNIEDSLADTSLRDVEAQSERLSAVKKAMEAVCAGAWLNARCDVFRAMADASLDDRMEELKRRAEAYAAAGADSLFVPFVRDVDEITKICAVSPLPVNVMRTLNGPPLADYAAAGVARVSHGPFPWSESMKNLTETSAGIYGGPTTS